MDEKLIEEAALAIWRAETGYECREPLRTKGGALDPTAYCMKLARALAEGGELPLKFKDVPTTRDDPAAIAAVRVLEPVSA